MPAGKKPKPAQSESQRNLMGMVQAYKDGTLKTDKMPKSLLAKIKKIAYGGPGIRVKRTKPMPSRDIKAMAHTKEAGLPRRVGENVYVKDFETFLNEEYTI